MRKRLTREFLLDVSRLIWRAWRGARPTGIDRVCLEYLDHFGSRSQAVIQFKGQVFVLPPRESDRLFAALRPPARGARTRLAAVAPLAWARAKRRPPRSDMTYLNVGHTGLHDSALPSWIESNEVRAVYLVHDLIPITHPQFCREGEAGKHRMRMQNALTSATGIVANSQATLSELAAFAKATQAPLPKSIVNWISGQRPPVGIQPRHLERPHFVTVGTIEGRKNHLLLLRIWQRLIAQMGKDTPILVIIGQRGWKAEEAFALLDGADELRGHVIEIGNANDEGLAALLAGATALLMPSFAEGFGLPVIEAIQVGTPVIASDLPVYREIVGAIPTYVDPRSELVWEEVIRSFLQDSSEQNRQRRAMKDYAAPDWQSHFMRLEAWLNDSRERPGRDELMFGSL
jgi:glycosyltransferase involved in cell wall biosynthesis